ncbi:MAG TPA: stalk domain-containing protein [Symbiobacteriaceae bacterium]|jgi:peptidoglycan/xylan/chitin deacetylase (PgdA/CDA1 family)|nr:stalk domain-containing protein [Symbiobacteriaceae bacterium]
MLKRLIAASATLLLLAGTAPSALVASTVVTRGQTQCRQVALTFDADAVAFRGIMNALAAHRVRSTFFLTGMWTDDFPALAAEITATGHDVGNHSNSHPDFTTISTTAMRNELRTAEAKNVGATVGWDPAAQRVTIAKGGTTVVMTIGSTAATVNGQPYTLDAASYLEQDRTQAPVRFVAEALGATVGWDEVSRTVTITP